MSGPVDPSVLTLQTNHWSVRAWEGSTSQLVTRQHYQLGYRLCTQTLGSINTLTEALSLTGYDYLIPTRPTTIDDDTLHTPSTSGSRHRGSSSRGSSRGSLRGSGRSCSWGRSSGFPSTSPGAMSPFVPPALVSTPPHPSPPNRILTY